MALATVEAALDIVLAGVVPLSAETVALDRAAGRTLAVPILAQRDQPPFLAAMMDGFALRRADGAVPRRLVGESAAGRAYAQTLLPGQAVRIYTGAPLPAGADRVLMQEEAELDAAAELVRPRPPALAGPDYTRAPGLDFARGETLLAAGRRLEPHALCLAAAAGCASLSVRRVPRIAVLTIGAELAAPPDIPRPDQIYESLRAGLAAYLALWGAWPVIAPILPDEPAALRAGLAAAAADADVVAVIGGASVGAYDFARAAFRALGGGLSLEGVAMRPGRPTWFGRTDRAMFLGLPGNPASALVAARLFLRPLIEALLGRGPEARSARLAARLALDLPANGDRRHYWRADLTSDSDGRLVATPDRRADSSLLTPFGAAGGGFGPALLVQEANAGPIEAGALVEILTMD